jgi:hypothetical protein
MRNVRNFWVVLTVDGKETVVETGPQAKDGGIVLKIYMRHEGAVMEALHVGGASDGEKNRLNVWDLTRGKRVLLLETDR